MTKYLPRKGGESKVTGGLIVICGDCINATYVTNVIWWRYAIVFVATDKGLYPKYIDIFNHFYLILRLMIIGQCNLSL